MSDTSANIDCHQVDACIVQQAASFVPNLCLKSYISFQYNKFIRFISDVGMALNDIILNGVIPLFFNVNVGITFLLPYHCTHLQLPYNAHEE